MAGVKYIASCSFGKDSLAMVLRLIEEKYPLDEVIFYDTGIYRKGIDYYVGLYRKSYGSLQKSEKCR